MKSKLVIIVGAVVVAGLASTATVAAARYIELPWTNNIYNVSSSDKDARGVTVSVFDDAGNKCYVVQASGLGSISSSKAVAIDCVESH